MCPQGPASSPLPTPMPGPTCPPICWTGDGQGGLSGLRIQSQLSGSKRQHHVVAKEVGHDARSRLPPGGHVPHPGTSPRHCLQKE